MAGAAEAVAADDLNEATIAQLQAAMNAGTLTSISLVNVFMARIHSLDQNGPTVNSVIEVHPDAKSIALALDAERRAGQVPGPLHAIPVLLRTTSTLATRCRRRPARWRWSVRRHPETAAARLRAAGAVILGKTTLSEWANFRSFFSSSGWSGRGGQVQQPLRHRPQPVRLHLRVGGGGISKLHCRFIGTETDGSIVCPANANGVVGIKPTVGLVSRAGVVRISHTQDRVGPRARTVADAARC